MDEESKAIQEVAKTTHKALDVGERVGSFLAKLLKEPMENAVGILGDRIRFLRYERQLRLIKRWEELVSKRSINTYRRVPPKLLIPIFENASLEEDDYIQDLWARLLRTAVDPEAPEIHPAFADIITQLRPIEAKILSEMYKSMPQFHSTSIDVPYTVGYGKQTLENGLFLPREMVDIAVDNLVRLNLLAPLQGSNILPGFVSFSYLGVAFIQACVTDIPIAQQDIPADS